MSSPFSGEADRRLFKPLALFLGALLVFGAIFSLLVLHSPWLGIILIGCAVVIILQGLRSTPTGPRQLTEAENRHRAAALYAQAGEFGQAAQLYEMALAIIEHIDPAALKGSSLLKTRYLKALILNDLGVARKNIGDLRTAIDCFEQALSIARNIGNRWVEASALGNLGIAYKRMGDNRRAIDYYQQQLVIVREIGDRSGEGNAMSNLANAYGSLGQEDEAMRYYGEAIEIDVRRGDLLGAAIDQLNAAHFLAGQGKTSEALSYARGAEQLYTRLGRTEEMYEARHLIAMLSTSGPQG
jgi:tetratricopeptide (TPR) repeat protein